MLEVKDLAFAYPGASRLLYCDFSFCVEAGERVELRAPSGFGKTTLCRILAGYEKPLAGEVLVDGAPLPKRGASPVQLILQHPELAIDPRMRMADTLAEGMAGSRERSLAGARSQLLSDGEVCRVVEGLGIREQWLSRFPHELSGGERQRFCVARALLAKPKYLIADEISTMLDAVTQAQIWGFILEELARENCGLVFVSHSSALSARIATRTVNLSD